MMVYIPYIITLFIIYLIFDGHKPDGFLVIPRKPEKKSTQKNRFSKRVASTSVIAPTW